MGVGEEIRLKQGTQDIKFVTQNQPSASRRPLLLQTSSVYKKSELKFAYW